MAEVISPRKGPDQHHNIIWDIGKSGVQIRSRAALSSYPHPKPVLSATFSGPASGYRAGIDDAVEDVPVMTRGAVVTHGTQVYLSVSSYGYECPYIWGEGERHVPHYVFSYNTSGDEWSTLPACRVHDFGLAVVDGLVTIVGGEYDKSMKRDQSISREFGKYYGPRMSGSLLVLDGGKWEKHFPPMTMYRRDPSVICAQQHLIVAGGVSIVEHYDGMFWFERLATVNSVEVMNTETKVWSQVASLPEAAASLAAAHCGDQLYFLGGRNEDGSTSSVFTCSVRSLVNSGEPLVMLSDSGEVSDKDSLTESSGEDSWGDSGENSGEPLVKSSDLDSGEPLIKSSDLGSGEPPIKSSDLDSGEPLVKPSDLNSGDPLVKSSDLDSGEPLVKSSDLNSGDPLVKSSDLDSGEPLVKSSDLDSGEPLVKSSDLDSGEPLVKSSDLDSGEPLVKSSDLDSGEPLVKSSDLDSGEPLVKSSDLDSGEPLVKSSDLDSGEPLVKSSDLDSGEPLVKSSDLDSGDPLVKSSDLDSGEPLVKSSDLDSGEPLVKSSDLDSGEPLVKSSDLDSGEPLVKSSDLDSGEPLVKSSDLDSGEPLVKSSDLDSGEPLVKSSDLDSGEPLVKSSDLDSGDPLVKSSDLDSGEPLVKSSDLDSGEPLVKSSDLDSGEPLVKSSDLDSGEPLVKSSDLDSGEPLVKSSDLDSGEPLVKSSDLDSGEPLVKSSDLDSGEPLVKSSDLDSGEPLVKSSDLDSGDPLVKSSDLDSGEPLVKSSDLDSGEPLVKSSDLDSGEPLVKSSDLDSGEPLVKSSDLDSGEPLVKSSDLDSGEPLVKSSDLDSGEPLVKSSDLDSGEPLVKSSDLDSGEPLVKSSDIDSGEPRVKSSDIDSGEKLKQQASESPVWQKAADVPVLRSTCVAINDELLAIGGRTSTYRSSADIYCYNPLEDSWQVAGQMPTARSMCIAASVMNKLVAVGGLKEEDKPTDVVEIGTLISDLTLTKKNLWPHLRSLEDWYTLGLQLDVPDDKLKEIEDAHPSGPARIKKTLDYWLKRGKNPSWETLTEAIVAMDRLDIATQIQKKYLQKPANGSSENSETPKSKMEDPTEVFAGHLQEKLKTSDSPQLGEKDLADAFRITFPVAKKWKSIGTFLKVPPHRLDMIDIPQKDFDDCLRDMLSVWLTQIDPLPTWQSLADAVRIFDPSVARQISH